MAINKKRCSDSVCLNPTGTNIGAEFCYLFKRTSRKRANPKRDIKKCCLLWLFKCYFTWQALLQPHLDRPESSAHFSAAVLLCNFQVSPPAPEDQQSALQLPQVVPVPWREGTAVAALQVTKITCQLNPYKHIWWIDRGGRVARMKCTINQTPNWNWLTHGPQYYTVLLLLIMLLYYTVISAIHITLQEENKREWTKQLNTAQPKSFNHINNWSLPLVGRKKTKAVLVVNN